METQKFKTNIKCSGCLEKVKPHLNEIVSENNWEVDLENPSRILSVKDHTSETLIKDAVQKAGFMAERI